MVMTRILVSDRPAASHLGLAVSLGLLLTGHPLTAQSLCTAAALSYAPAGDLDDMNEEANCPGTFPASFCFPPDLGALSVSVDPPGCDPETESCTVSLSVPTTFPDLHQNDLSLFTSFGNVRLIAPTARSSATAATP
jgi:hypothetical protein